ncbi:MAG TPA: aspartyl protease family protein [Rhizomicrobium sp.]|nr:aspartyl protease family protein [Rhizomicrobium sp.]
MRRLPGAALAAFFLAATAAQAGTAPVLALPSANHSPSAAAAPTGPDLLFEQGEFEQARIGYEAVPKSSPKYEDALRQLGAIALAQNHLGEAENLLTGAHARNPADLHCVGLLAETLNREGRFADMAQLLKQLGRPERAAEFALFGKSVPYRVVGKPGAVTIEFQWTAPLPVVRAKVNGVEGLFLIDTGAPEIILDPDFARDAHVQATAAAAAGSRGAAPSFGRVGQFVLPGLETDDVPALLLTTRGLSSVARNKRIAGVIGTEFLSHFRPTLDYVHDRMILEPLDTPSKGAGAIAEIPFWFVGDHFLLARGRLDQGPKQLFLVDTGMAHTAFTAPDSTLRDAGVPVPAPQGPARSAIGQPPSAPFPIASLSLGSLTEKNITGAYGPFPLGLENGLGVHIGGIVSHGFFEPYAVTFDFVRMTIAIRK